MDIAVGTSGYNYPEWKGTFYPDPFPASKMFAYYAERFRTVEINYTFYRMPTPKLTEGWRDQAPEGFRYTLKAPRKRPFHTIIPAFVTRTARPSGVLRDATGEEPFLAFGVMGGAMQPQGHVQVLLNLLLFGMDVQQASDAPRFRHMAGRRVALESPIGDDVRSALRTLGHEIIDERSIAFGGAQLVMKLPRGWVAGSDSRKDEHAAGR